MRAYYAAFFYICQALSLRLQRKLGRNKLFFRCFLPVLFAEITFLPYPQSFEA